MRQILIAAIGLLLASPALAQEDAANSLSFLKLSGAASLAASGDIHASGFRSPEASRQNPALLSVMTGVQTSFNYSILPTEGNTDLVSAAVGGNGGFGLGLTALILRSGELELRNGPTADPIATSNPQNFALGVSISTSIADSLYVGLTGKWINEHIVQYNADGYGFDIGALYRISSEYEVGVSVLDLGSMGKLNNEASTLPSRLTASISAAPEALQFTDISTMISLSHQLPLEGSTSHTSVGASASYRDMVGIAASYITGFETRGLILGASLHFDPVRISYAFAPSMNGFNSTNQFGLAVSF